MDRMISEDATRIFAENEKHRHRRGDKPPRGLYTVDEWAAMVERGAGYTNRVVTFAPEKWRAAVSIDQHEYTSLFASQFPEVHHVLLSVPGICCAGGAAAWPLLTVAVSLCTQQ